MKKFTSNGWITDKGEFIPCSWAQHSVVLSRLEREGKINSYVAEKTWLKITDNRITGEFQLYFLGDTITQPLIDTFFDWCKFYKTDYARKYFEENYGDIPVT